MNRIYYITLFVFAVFAGTACQDNLDTLPEGDIVSTKQKEGVVANDPDKAEASVNAVFAQFSQMMPNEDALNAERHNDFGYPSNMMFMDTNGNDMLSEDNGYNWVGNNLEFSDRVFTSREGQIVWNNLYAMIRAANNVVGAIPSDVEDPTSQFYLAQGLSVRAFSYWNLAQLYQFNYVGNEKALCVPIITPENADAAAIDGVKRSTVEEVYALIISDLGLAIESLTAAEKEGVSRKDKRYVDLAVAYGLRARVNLTMQKWKDAATDADAAIDMTDAKIASLADVAKPAFWTVDEVNWMWGIIISETDEVVTSGIVNWLSHMGSLNYGYANFSGGRQINKILYNSIPESDVRKGWWINEEKLSENLTKEMQATMDGYGYAAFTQVKFAPYKNEMKSSTNASDIPLMRVEEMHLIKAEALAMSGGDGITPLVNFVKTYRDPGYDFSGDVQEEVFRQRRIELWGEGLNWFDIMRLNKGVDRRGAGYPNATMVFNIPAGSDILLWRIPEAEIQANPALSAGDNNPSAPAPKPVEE